MTELEKELATRGASYAGWTPTRVLVVALCFLLNMLDGADLLIMSFVAPSLAQ
ncbi:MAG: hypothetical protein JWO25_2353, partial [Alphaproteobacteria bacterium]|nr:hypothetical protein [Alphaproteobacteria bacterium]